MFLPCTCSLQVNGAGRRSKSKTVSSTQPFQLCVQAFRHCGWARATTTTPATLHGGAWSAADADCDVLLPTSLCMCRSSTLLCLLVLLCMCCSSTLLCILVLLLYVLLLNTPLSTCSTVYVLLLNTPHYICLHLCYIYVCLHLSTFFNTPLSTWFLAIAAWG